MDALMLSTPGKIFSKHIEIVFSYFSQKTVFDFSCKLSPLETIYMKCPILFSGKKKKKKILSICHLLFSCEQLYHSRMDALSLSTLGKIFSWHIEIFFLFFPENGFTSMLIVLIWDNLLEMSNPVFWKKKKKKKIVNLPSAVLAQKVVLNG